MFSEAIALDVPTAYKVQSAVAQLRTERGEKVIGYKVGCTSPVIRAQLGIDHRVVGRLYDSEQHASGAILSCSKYANLAIEGELAVQLSRAPHAQDFSSRSRIPPCVSRILPVIELHNHVMRGKPSASELIANNAIHAGFVAGQGEPATIEFGETALSIFADGELLDECAGEALIETLRSSLEWITEASEHLGVRLNEGQIVLTGSIPALIPIKGDCAIQVVAPPFGGVEARFIGDACSGTPS